MELQHIFKCQGTFVGHEVGHVCAVVAISIVSCRGLFGLYAHGASSCSVLPLTTPLRYEISLLLFNRTVL